MLDNSSPAGFANMNLAGHMSVSAMRTKDSPSYERQWPRWVETQSPRLWQKTLFVYPPCDLATRIWRLEGLSNLAQRPYGRVTYGDLKFHPLWDSAPR